MGLRKIESKKLENNPDLTTGDVTTINLTMLSGGSQGLKPLAEMKPLN